MADDLIPHQVIIVVSILLGVLGIYLSDISGIFSIIATVFAIILGTNTLRQVGKYSLGTGVPSIIYMLTASGVISTFGSIGLSFYFNQIVLFPVISILVSFLIGYLISLICKYIFKIKVEILSKSFITICISSVIAVLSMSSLIATTYNINVIFDTVIKNGLIIFIMLMTVMAIQNPYNSCMGANEEQYRTIFLAISNTFLMLMIISLICILTSPYWYVYLIISFIGWLISIRKYIKYSMQQAALIKWSGLWPKLNEGD